MTRPPSGPFLIGVRRKSLNYYASLEQVQTVWAAVTQNPKVTVTYLAERLGTSRNKAWLILKFLERAGYIRHESGCVGRTVVIPFVCVDVSHDK